MFWFANNIFRRALMDSAELQIIIVNYNSTDALITCLESIQNNSKLAPAKIWVWDNNSKEKPRIIQNLFSQVNLVESTALGLP